MTTKNLKSQIIDNINDIANGVRKDSNARLTLVVQLQEAEKSKKFDFNFASQVEKEVYEIVESFHLGYGCLCLSSEGY